MSQTPLIDGHTQLFGLFASPAAHSKSPRMHNLAFAAREINARYLAFEVTRETLPDAIAGLRALNMGGVNLSMPLKEAVIPLLDRVDATAQIVGAVNTIVNRDGKLTGYTTDGLGILNALPANLTLATTSVVLFGAGGAAKSAAVALALAGVQQITIINRHVDPDSRGVQLQNLLYAHTNCPVHLLPLANAEAVRAAVADADLLINATSLGMAPNVDGCPIPDTSYLHPNMAVFDMVYNPLETRLLQFAKAAGVTTRINGLALLVHQGAASFKLWTGQDMPVADVIAALQAE